MSGKVLEESYEKFLNPGRVPPGQLRSFLWCLANLRIDDPNATEKFLRDYSIFFWPDQGFLRHQQIAVLIKTGYLSAPVGNDGVAHPEEGPLSNEQEKEARYQFLYPMHRWLRAAWTANFPDDEKTRRHLERFHDRDQSNWLRAAWSAQEAAFIREDIHPEAREAFDDRAREWIIDIQLRNRFWEDWINGDARWRTPLYSLVQRRFYPPPYRFEQAMTYLKRNLHLIKICLNRKCAEPYFWAAKPNRLYCSDQCAAPAKKAAKLKWWNDNRKGKERQ